MNNRFQLFYWAMVAIAILLSAVTATGQTVALGEINASAGEEVIVPLNFTDITAAGSAAFYIEFNQDVLTYVNFQNAIPELSGNALIVNYIPGLYLTIQWFTLSSAVNFPDGTAIELIFDYAGGDTDVSFIEGSYVKDASNPPNTLAVTFVNGSVTGQSGSDQSAWNGTGNWMEEANWSNGIPGSETEAIIETGTVNIASGALCDNITVNSGAVINIEPNYFLTVLNDVTIAGTMNILSDETGTGSFLPKGSLNVTGTFNAERYVSGGPSHFFSAPVQGLQSNSLNGANSEKYEQSGSWASVGSTDPLSTGKGYRITTGSSQTFTLTGLPINSDVTITNLTSGGGGNGYPAGLNLIGNPFTCALDRNHESWGSQNLDASIYILSDYNYKVWNGQVGNITEGIIPAMQGFFVVVNGSNPSLTIPADARKNEFEPYYKSDEKLAEYEILRISSGDMYDEMFIQFDPSSGLNFDPGFDAYKLPGSGAAPQIYSFTNDGQKVAINCIPDNDTTYHLNLGIVVPDNALDIVIEYIRTYTYYGDLVLLDTEPFIKLDLDIDSVYHFSATPGTYNDRFKIYFTYFTGINSIEAPKVDIYFSNGFFHINSNDFLQQAEFKVYTLDGKLAGRSTFSQLKQKSIKAPVINGLVIVTLETGSLQISKKILLIR